MKSEWIATNGLTSAPSGRIFGMLIRTPKEFRFSECLRFLDRSKQERLHLVERNGITKLIRIDNHSALVSVTSPSPGSLEVHFLNGVPTEAMRFALKNYIRTWLDLDTDLAPFYRLAARDRLLKNLVQNYYGLRLIRISDLFQALCWAIIGQQINLRFAYTLYGRFIESFGEKLEFEGKDYWLFPSHEEIARLQVTDLRQLQFTGKKSEYIIGLAQQIRDGTISKDKLAECTDYEEALRRLVTIRGVGEWTANYVLMRCLGFNCAFPIQDIGLQRAIQLQLKTDSRPSIEQIRALSVGWTNWEAYATFYLYRSLL